MNAYGRLKEIFKILDKMTFRPFNEEDLEVEADDIANGRPVPSDPLVVGEPKETPTTILWPIDLQNDAGHPWLQDLKAKYAETKIMRDRWVAYVTVTPTELWFYDEDGEVIDRVCLTYKLPTSK